MGPELGDASRTEKRTNLRDSSMPKQQDSYGRSRRKDRSPQGPGSQSGEARHYQEVEEAKKRDIVKSCWLGAGTEAKVCGVREGAGTEAWGLKINLEDCSCEESRDGVVAKEGWVFQACGFKAGRDLGTSEW